jgi:hypothetical protein
MTPFYGVTTWNSNNSLARKAVFCWANLGGWSSADVIDYINVQQLGISSTKFLGKQTPLARGKPLIVVYH